MQDKILCPTLWIFPPVFTLPFPGFITPFLISKFLKVDIGLREQVTFPKISANKNETVLLLLLFLLLLFLLLLSKFAFEKLISPKFFFLYLFTYEFVESELYRNFSELVLNILLDNLKINIYNILCNLKFIQKKCFLVSHSQKYTELKYTYLNDCQRLSQIFQSLVWKI